MKKDIKLWAVGLPTLFLLGVVLLSQKAPEIQADFPSVDDKVASSIPTNTEQPTENTWNHQNESPSRAEDVSLEITELDEALRLHVLIHNKREEELVYSTHYSLSKLEEQTWVPVNLDMAFTEVAYHLSGNRTAEETIYLDYFEQPLTSGTYRLEKILSGVPYHDTFTID